MLILLDAETYDLLIEALERKPLPKEEVPKIHALLTIESPFAKDSECTE